MYEKLEDFGEGIGLDDGIRHYVLTLRKGGIETCQSCEGGPGHTYAEPTVDFLGGPSEGPRAVAVALTYGLPISELRRTWNIQDNEMTGPIWSLTFNKKANAHLAETEARERAWLEDE